jgi:hypothetical protein
VFEEPHDIDVVHQHNPDDGCEAGKATGMYIMGYVPVIYKESPHQI